MINFIKYNCILLFALVYLNGLGQIDIKHLKSEFGEGEITQKKNINITFHVNNEDNFIYAKIGYSLQKLFIGSGPSNKLIQIPFNTYETVNIKKARFYNIDSLGNKFLVENIKTKYVDTKDYFIENIFFHDLKVKQFRNTVKLIDNFVYVYDYEVVIEDLKFLNRFFFQEINEAVEEINLIVHKHPQVNLSLFDFNFNGKITKIEDESKIEYHGKNLKRFNVHSKSTDVSYYSPHIVLSVNTILIGNKTIEILNSTKNLYDWYYKLISELKGSTPIIKELADSLIRDKNSDEDKIASIYFWVQQNIQYIAFENGIAGFKPTESEEVIHHKYGDCKGMANLLVDLLSSVGFDASHGWIGTRSNNYNYSMPSLVVDNHMICILHYNGKDYFLDATHKSLTWKDIPSHIEGKEVLTTDNDKYNIKKIPVSPASFNTISIIGNLNIDSNTPKISCKVNLSGNFITDFSNTFNSLSRIDKINYPYYFIEKFLKGINIEEVRDLEIFKDKVSFNITGQFKKYARNDKGTTIFPLFILTDYPVLEDTDPPIYIPYQYCITLNYDIISRKKNINPSVSIKKNLSHENYKLDYSVSKNGDYVHVKQDVEIDAQYIPLKTYKTWNHLVSVNQFYSTIPLQYDK